MVGAETAVGSRAHIPSAVVLAGAAVLAIVTSYVAFGSDSLLKSDGQHFLAVAENITDLRNAPEGVTTYRMSRPLYPALSWLVVAGQTQALLAGMIVVYVLSVFGIGYAASRLSERPLPHWYLLLCPAFWFTVPHVVSEPMVVYLTLLTFVVAIKHRARAPVVAALAMLTKESAAVAFFPFFFRAVRERRYGEALGWVASGVPLLLWWVVLHEWTGRWPWQDSPGPAKSGIDIPFMGMVRAIPDQWELAASGQSDAMPWVIFSMILGVATFAIALARWDRNRSSLLWQAAVWTALLMVSTSWSTWAHPGEALRLMLPAQVLIMIAWRRDRESSHLAPA